MIARNNLIKDLGRVLFWFPLRWSVTVLPFSVVYFLGGILGQLDFLFSGQKRRDRMVGNITTALSFDEKEGEETIKSNLQNHCRNVLELIKYPHLSQKSLGSILSFQGLEILDLELAKGKGVLLATSHFGAKQLLQVGLGLKGYTVNQIRRHMDDSDLTFIQKNVSQRQRLRIEEGIPANFIQANGFLRPAYECLKRNEILIIAADGSGLSKYMKNGHLPVRFLGKEVLFPSNTVSLARRTGASMIPAFVVRQGIKHRMIVEPPLDVSSDENGLREFASLLEKYVLKYPFLWEFWEEFDCDNLIHPEKEVHI